MSKGHLSLNDILDILDIAGKKEEVENDPEMLQKIQGLLNEINSESKNGK